jgi:hypothetical protein
MKRIHLVAALVGTCTIAVFFASTVLVELLGSPDAMAAAKSLIVLPGLLVLVPALATAGASGFLLSRTRQGPPVEAKKKRMPVIGGLGLLVLLPCALLLDAWAAQERFDTAFYLVQAIELTAGAMNLALMGLNVRDGLRLTAGARHYNCNNGCSPRG